MVAVGLRPKLLSADEHEVLTTRTHAKALVGPAFALVALGGVVGAGTALIPTDFRPSGQVVVALAGLALAIRVSVVPYLRWRTTTYTVTDRRLVTRSGIVTKMGQDLPLNRVNEIAISRSLLDRMLGCGTLRIQTAAELGTVELTDVPEVEHVHAELSELLFGVVSTPAGSPSWGEHPR